MLSFREEYQRIDIVLDTIEKLLKDKSKEAREKAGELYLEVVRFGAAVASGSPAMDVAADSAKFFVMRTVAVLQKSPPPTFSAAAVTDARAWMDLGENSPLPEWGVQEANKFEAAAKALGTHSGKYRNAALSGQATFLADATAYKGQRIPYLCSLNASEGYTPDEAEKITRLTYAGPAQSNRYGTLLTAPYVMNGVVRRGISDLLAEDGMYGHLTRLVGRDRISAALEGYREREFDSVPLGVKEVFFPLGTKDERRYVRVTPLTSACMRRTINQVQRGIVPGPHEAADMPRDRGVGPRFRMTAIKQGGDNAQNAGALSSETDGIQWMFDAMPPRRADISVRTYLRLAHGGDFLGRPEKWQLENIARLCRLRVREGEERAMTADLKRRLEDTVGKSAKSMLTQLGELAEDAESGRLAAVLHGGSSLGGIPGKVVALGQQRAAGGPDIRLDEATVDELARRMLSAIRAGLKDTTITLSGFLERIALNALCKTIPECV